MSPRATEASCWLTTSTTPTRPGTRRGQQRARASKTGCVAARHQSDEDLSGVGPLANDEVAEEPGVAVAPPGLQGLLARERAHRVERHDAGGGAGARNARGRRRRRSGRERAGPAPGEGNGSGGGPSACHPRRGEGVLHLVPVGGRRGRGDRRAPLRHAGSGRSAPGSRAPARPWPRAGPGSRAPGARTRRRQRCGGKAAACRSGDGSSTCTSRIRSYCRRRCTGAASTRSPGSAPGTKRTLPSTRAIPSPPNASDSTASSRISSRPGRSAGSGGPRRTARPVPSRLRCAVWARVLHADKLLG